jgi:hypothetical protein
MGAVRRRRPSKKGVKTIMLRLFSIWIVLTLSLFCNQITCAQSTTPLPGESCSEPEAVYNYSTNILKSPWKLHELYALPLGLEDPSSWDSSEEFKIQFSASLGAGQTPADFSAACAAVWQDFFEVEANVVVKASRTIKSTNFTLRCTDGIWSTIASENREFSDVTEWTLIENGPFSVTSPESASVLQTSLESVLNALNTQPGATSQ